MSGVIVIDERDALAGLLVACLCESPAVQNCRRLRVRNIYSGSGLARALARELDDQGIQTIVYSPSRLSPLRLTPDLAEAEAILRRCATANLKKVILLSSAQVYGASCHNQGLIPESRLPLCLNRTQLARDWIDLEGIAATCLSNSGTELTILRPAAVLSLGSADYFSRLLRGPLAMVLPGHDPSLQFLSPDDLAAAVRCAVERSGGGIYNVTPDGVITLRAALRLTCAKRLTFPRTLRRIVHDTDHLDLIRYSWTVSNKKIKSDLGFVPLRSSAEAVAEFATAENGRGRSSRDAMASIDFDDFGMDKDYIAAYGRTLFKFLSEYYWRLEHQGLEHVPSRGRAVLVGVHRGFMPWDAALTLDLIVRQLRRYPRFLIHPGLIKFPFLFNFHTKLGGMVACQDNADRVLEDDELLTIYPEGIRGAFGLFREPYRLKRFRDDYVKIALRHRAPIVPFVTVGSAEIFPIFARLDWRWWIRWTEWPCFPLTPTWPLLPVPLPSKWHLKFLAPIHIEDRYPPEAANDAATVSAITAEVKATMTHAIDQMLGRRKSIWFGSIFDDENPVY